MSVTQVPQGGSSTSGGGGTGGAGTFVPPPTAGWTWTNQSTTTRVDAADGQSFTLKQPPNGGGGPSYSLYTRPIPATRRVTAAFRCIISLEFSTGLFPFAGMCLFDNVNAFITTGLLFNGTAFNGPGMALEKWTNPTTFSAGYLTGALGHFQDVTWVRFNQPAAAGNRSIEWSLDGEIWLPTPLSSAAYNDFTLPTRFGLAISSPGVSGTTSFGSTLKLLSWDES